MWENLLHGVCVCVCVFVSIFDLSQPVMGVLGHFSSIMPGLPHCTISLGPDNSDPITVSVTRVELLCAPGS